jgi:hypothetical protein
VLISGATRIPDDVGAETDAVVLGAATKVSGMLGVLGAAEAGIGILPGTGICPELASSTILSMSSGDICFIILVANFTISGDILPPLIAASVSGLIVDIRDCMFLIRQVGLAKIFDTKRVHPKQEIEQTISYDCHHQPLW